MSFQKVFFKSDKHLIAGTCYLPSKSKDKGLLFLHGGGKASKERFRELQEKIGTYGYPSFAFDFSGVGESEGIFHESSLLKRLSEAHISYNFFQKYVKHIILVSTSMGGHVACRLTEFIDTEGLILLYPAAYGQDAEEKTFTKDLTKVLRKKRSWENSRVFPLLSSYKKPTLIIFGENDEVVPLDVQEKFKKAAKNGTFVRLKEGRHLLLAQTNETEKKIKEQTYNHVLLFLESLL